MTWRDCLIAVVAFLLFIAAYMSKAAGRVSFVEGAAILVGYVVVVTVVAIIVELVRKDV